MKATEQYFPVVLFIKLCKVILTNESVDEILKCVKVSVDEILKCGRTFIRYCLLSYLKCLEE